MRCMRCIICGLDREPSKEHIIPEALGNKEFITDAVCIECNTKLGANVDNYLTDYIIIKIIRKSLGLTGKKDKEVKIFPATAQDKKGNRYVFRNDEPIITPQVSLSDGILHIEADSIESGTKIAKVKLEKLGMNECEIERIMKTMTVGERQNERPEFLLPTDLNQGRYLLSGIKIAYEYANKRLGNIYFEDGTAKELRKILKDVIDSRKEVLDDVVDYSNIRKYASILQTSSKKIKDKVYPLIKNMTPPARHLCLLHGSKMKEIICDVFLFMEDITSFTVLVSKDSSLYDVNINCGIAIILENGQSIEV